MAQYCELTGAGLIAFTGDDAVAFLHAQLTSDVVGLAVPATQYSGYCTPKGRLLATGLLWRLQDVVLLQLPAALREAIQSRLSQYSLRSRVKASDATPRYALFGISGANAAAAMHALVGPQESENHQIISRDGTMVMRVPGERYVVLTPREGADTVRATLDAHAAAASEESWTASEIAAGVPVITQASQEEYVPQMVNLDLIGAVSYSKGCYPGQEIVARTHYLGRLKQRMYRIALPPGVTPSVGDRLYSDQFGAEQASGSIVDAVLREDGAAEALAVMQIASVARGLHYGSLDGPAVEVLPLPYEVTAAV